MRFLNLLTITPLIVLALTLSAAPTAWSQTQQPAATPTAPKASSLDDLLRQVKRGWKKENRENQQRETRFLGTKKDQEKLLRQAQATLKREEDRSEQLEDQFAQNEIELASLEERLAEALGILGELFGVVRQVAGDTRSTVENSLVSAEFPGRHEFLIALGQNTAMPSIADLEGLWYALQQEMTESGVVSRFSTQINQPDGTAATAEVVRVGPFIAVSDGQYLKWETKVQQLQALDRQPPSRYVSTLDDLEGATSGLVRVAIDPARGSLLAALIASRTARERIEDGGVIGYAIIVIGLATFALALLRLIAVFLESRRVKSQIHNSESQVNNALGRVLSVVNENDDANTETLELKLDEATLRETARIERYLWAIKVVAAIAPLMGLLGTVTGMIQTFQAITLFGTGDPKLMADGISVALVTTMLGLCVAIPLVLMHSVIASMAKVVVDILEEQSAGIVARRAEGS
jgi:biopolymer transport protein ExbB